MKGIPVKIRLSADHCSAYNEVNSVSDQAAPNESSQILWCMEWQVVYNTHDTLTVTTTRKRSPLEFDSSFDCATLSVATEYTYFKNHIH